MDANSTSSVKTRYSFYQAADTEELVHTEPKKTNSDITESNTLESDETASYNDHDKPVDKYQSRESPLSKNLSTPNGEESKETKRKISRENKKREGKPPRPDVGMNVHERAIREALLYIRKRGQQREKISDKSSSTLEDWKKDQLITTNLPIALSPGIDGSTALANATTLENRLLSPPADVRKAASDMFRTSPHENTNETDIIKGLELAHPVNSMVAPVHGKDSVMDTTEMQVGSNAVESSISHFSITPSSPAAGKFHGIQPNGQYSTSNDLETPDARRQKLHMERSMRREVEVEKGVERVLQMILQRAENSAEANPEESMEHVLSSIFAEHSVSPSDSGTEKNRMMRTNNNSDDNTEANDPEDFTNEITMSDPNDQYNGESETPIRPFSIKEGTLEVEAIDSGTTESYFEEEKEDSNEDEMVLGRLSSRLGGTTGVVLQDDDSDTSNDDEGKDEIHSIHDEDDIDQDDYDAAPLSPSLISSVTSAARRTSKLVASTLSFNSSPKNTDDDIEEVVKDLYSHILVVHPSHRQRKNSNKKDYSLAKWMSDHFTSSTAVPPDMLWDEEDPEEPGYVVHTLSRGKLQEIEQVYEEMVDQAGSEYAIAMKDKIGKNRMGSDFERDLLDAEKMLDNQKLTLKSKANAKNKKKADKEKDESSSKNSTGDLLTNPNFPGAKAAGSGEVGDLEIYHLPIIYKAHQTGFEPTKDLVLQPDTVFAGQYYVQSELGSAAFSTAYRCVDLNSGKKSEDGEVYYDEVCLKVIKNTKDFFDQSLDEIKILELLRQTSECNEHNILEMKAFFYHKEHLIIVTELLRQNLFEFGKYILEHDEPKYFTRSRLCYIARQCLVALSFVHNLGLVHSDIKPENILLASYSRARVKVIDFGSSCYLTDRQSSYIQSRSYRAPEVVLGLPYDGKIDVWSLGCVIAEMYTGNVTFQNDSVVSMLARIEAICGAFPRHMIEEGRQNGQFFTPTGLLYEKVETDDDSAMQMDASSSFQDDENAASSESTLFNVLQPKTTTMAERLGFDPDLMNSKRNTWEEDEKALFTDFVTKLLTVDPDKRPSAEEALQHPWILSGFNLTEDDLKYPPEE